jgi:hypothetical protein
MAGECIESGQTLWRVLEFAKLANFRRVLEFDKFAGEWPLLKKAAFLKSPGITYVYHLMLT